MLLHPVPIEIVFQFSRAIGHPPPRNFPVAWLFDYPANILERVELSRARPHCKTQRSVFRSLDSADSTAKWAFHSLLIDPRCCRPSAIFHPCIILSLSSRDEEKFELLNTFPMNVRDAITQRVLWLITISWYCLYKIMLQHTCNITVPNTCLKLRIWNLFAKYSSIETRSEFNARM